ncbi:erythromycin esterase family protein [Nocardia sp. NPDC003963]
MASLDTERAGTRIFHDRREAGAALARLLEHYRGEPDLLVLGLARGGLPVAWEVAAALEAPLDTMIVRKLGAPGDPEFAIGALASDGRIVLNDDVVRALRLSAEQVRDIAREEAAELDRRAARYRAGRGPLEMSGRTVILVDDGLATGASMFAAVEAVRSAEPKRIVVAVAAAPESTCRELGAAVDELVCATVPSPFRAVGESYWDFGQVTDEQVGRLLAAPTAGVPGRLPPDSSAVLRDAAVAAPAGIPPWTVLGDLVGDARFVLIGESSHGTYEFYAARAAITKWLIEQRGFTAVAAEADWPDAYRVDRYVRGHGADRDAEDALAGFERFPSWMWRNTVVRDFVGWLHGHNARCRGAGAPETGFYGLDLYSLHRSMRAVVRYLEQADPPAAQRARARYSCFDQVSGDDGEAYGLATAFGAGEGCAKQVVEQLVELQRGLLTTAMSHGGDSEEQFDVLRNAWSVRNAEAYYRAMLGGRVHSWNMRDRHMAQTLDALATHLARPGDYARIHGEPRIVVWAHNSHVGDARATELGAEGQITLGQLVRERHGDRCRTIGFSTGSGTVTAARKWGGPALRETVREPLPSSLESLLRDTGKQEFLLRLDTRGAVTDHLGTPRIQRAIGVVYSPGTERQSHYYHARAAQQYDALIHIDRTTALQPLQSEGDPGSGTVPESYPTGL